MTASRRDRVERLRASRREDSDGRKNRVRAALADLTRQGTPITIGAVAAAAGVHRNFIGRHSDIRAEITASRPAAGRPECVATPVSEQSLRTELATARHQSRDLQERVHILERRLSEVGVPESRHKDETIRQLTDRVADLESALVAREREARQIEDDLAAATDLNRSLIRELNRS